MGFSVLLLLSQISVYAKKCDIIVDSLLYWFLACDMNIQKSYALIQPLMDSKAALPVGVQAHDTE